MGERHRFGRRSGAVALPYDAEDAVRVRLVLAMAKRIHTSRTALDRLLDAGRGAVTLPTFSRVAHAVGRVPWID
jgi:hypothetical protein